MVEADWMIKATSLALCLNNAAGAPRNFNRWAASSARTDRCFNLSPNALLQYKYPLTGMMRPAIHRPRKAMFHKGNAIE
jgi:hypothetical protein